MKPAFGIPAGPAVIGVGFALLIAAGSAAYNRGARIEHGELKAELQQRVERLHAQCVAEGRQLDATHDGWPAAELACDPHDLARLTGYGAAAALRDIDAALNPAKPMNTQDALGLAQRTLDEAQDYRPILWPYALSLLLIAVTVVLPWAWYFLLRRIRELGDAIRG